MKQKILMIFLLPLLVLAGCDLSGSDSSSEAAESSSSSSDASSSSSSTGGEVISVDVYVPTGGTSYLHSIVIGGKTIYDSGNPWDGYTTSDGYNIWTISLTTGTVGFYLMTANDDGAGGIMYPYSGTTDRTITSNTTKIEFTTFQEFSIGYSIYSSDGGSTAYTN